MNKFLKKIIVTTIFFISTTIFGANIVIKAEEVNIKVSLNSTKTSEEFLNMLPLELDMNNWDDREFYGKLSKRLFDKEEMLETYSNGDVTYYPRGNSLAIFYDKENVSKQSGLIKIGEVTSDLSIFKKLPKNIKVYIEKESEEVIK